MRSIKIVLILSLAFAYGTYADPFDFYCSGPLARSIGCTGIALSEGYESTYLNPALISSKNKLGIGYIFASQNVDVSLQNQKLEKIGNPLENVSLLHLGASLRLSDLSFIFEKSNVLDNISLGVSAALPATGRAVRVGTSDTKIPSTPMYGNRNTRLSTYIGLSGRIPLDNIRIYIGGGVHALARLNIFVDANLSPDRDLLGIDGFLKLLNGFLGGVAFELDQETFFLRFGAVIRTPVQTEIPTEVNVNIAGETALKLVASLIEHYTPTYFGGGIGGGIKSSSLKISVGADILQYKFTDLKLPLLKIQEVSPEEIRGILPSHSTPEFQDVIVIKGGLSTDIYDIIGEADILAGAGVSLFPSPLKSQNGTLFVDSDRLTISGGLGTRFKSPGIVKGEIEFILSGGIQMLSKKEFSDTQTSIEGTLPIISGTLNVLF
ncbi:MAG: hypothetical protein NZ927_00480 [Candidatus Calescibacterium sp.]|nr:hypothetical protein [Candidatus Calescibacterium sp.]MDW8086626.1 hypothetical protein [Candidatus Calescibacterium sp.]